MLSFFIVIPAHPLPLEYTHYIILQILCQFSKTLYSSYDSFAYTATDGKKYNVDYYNLDVIISVGYRVKSHRGTQFRIWAMGIIKEYMKKGFALDDDRLKRLGGGNYFDELLARIRDIRSAEKKYSGERFCKSMQPALIMIPMRKTLSCSSNRFKTKCTGLPTSIPPPK